jgi:O-antigen/teichoic acid export membrane protein
VSTIEISKRVVFVNSASSALTLLLNLSVLVWLQQYLLKRISPEEYSLIPIVMSIMAFSPLLTSVLTQGLGRYITVAYAKGDNEEVTRICSTMFPILLAAGIGLLAVGWIGAWHIDKILNIPQELVAEARLMMGLLVLPAAARLPLAIFGSGFLVRQKLMLHDMIDIACQVLRITVLLALLLAIDSRALWVTVASVVSELAYLAITTPISMRLVPSQKASLGLFRRRVAKEVIAYGGWGLVSQIAETIKQAFDPLILNRFASAVEVSVFYVAGIAPRQLRLMVNPITRPFFPVLAGMYATGDLIRLRNTYLRTARYHAWILLAVGVPAIVFSNEVMHLYLDGKYDNAGPVMAILIVIAILSGFNALGPAVVAVVTNLKEFALRIVFVYVMNLVLTVSAVAYLQKGAYGSAVATLLTVGFLEVTVVWTYCRRLAGARTDLWIREVILPTVVPALIPLSICLAARAMIDVDTWFEVFTFSILSAIVYLGLVATFGLREADRIDVARVVNRLPGPIKNFARYFAEE